MMSTSRKNPTKLNVLVSNDLETFIFFTEKNRELVYERYGISGKGFNGEGYIEHQLNLETDARPAFLEFCKIQRSDSYVGKKKDFE